MEISGGTSFDRLRTGSPTPPVMGLRPLYPRTGSDPATDRTGKETPQ
jgi:hypothetical protein